MISAKKLYVIIYYAEEISYILGKKNTDHITYASHLRITFSTTSEVPCMGPGYPSIIIPWSNITTRAPCNKNNLILNPHCSWELFVS